VWEHSSHKYVIFTYTKPIGTSHVTEGAKP
jgi:hypothetical protein